MMMMMMVMMVMMMILKQTLLWQYFWSQILQFLSTPVLILWGNPPRLEPVKSSTLKWMSNPPIHSPAPLDPAAYKQFHVFFARVSFPEFPKEIHGNEAKKPRSSHRRQDLKWNLLCFTYGLLPPPLPPSLSRCTRNHPCFIQVQDWGRGPGLLASSTSWHQGFRKDLAGSAHDRKWQSNNEAGLIDVGVLQGRLTN